MDKSDIQSIAADGSASASLELAIRLENGRLSPEKRAAVAAIIQRVCTGLTVQLDMAVPDRYEIVLKRRSSATGEVTLDIGSDCED